MKILENLRQSIINKEQAYLRKQIRITNTTITKTNQVNQRKLASNYLLLTVGSTLLLALKLQILNRGTSNQGGDLGRDLDPILQAQEDSYQLVSKHPLFEGKIDFDPSRMNPNEILRSMQQSVEGLARQFQIVARNVEYNASTYGYHDIPQHRGGRRGGLGGKGYRRPQEEYPRQEAWHDDNSYEDDRDNPNVGQAYHGRYNGNQQGDKALDKIKWKVPRFKGYRVPNVVTPTVTGSFLSVGELASNYLSPMVGSTLPSLLQILNRGTSNQGGGLGRDLDPILQAQEDSYQTLTMNHFFKLFFLLQETPRN
ncbi:hypothetical protein M9H77_18425 [Catharanthus roseus]|uniref:Uncharacterized protein n=1 Tax=Catharanthus roseus TaxID=4058 RepID=A0ACC0B7K9_CATRO|nr:hypothetical protein M9H77_18425 [Catharanthus roseus]